MKKDKETNSLDSFERIFSLDISSNLVENFLTDVSDISIRDLDHIPYKRFLLAKRFEDLINIRYILKDTLTDFKKGAVSIDFNQKKTCWDDCIKISTAISHLLGVPDLDPLSGKYYATFTVQHAEASLPHILRPYEDFKMHTDGAYLKQTPDWIFFMKMEENEAVGGESKLLHVDDWEEFIKYYSHSLQQRQFKFIAPPSDRAPICSQEEVTSQLLKADQESKSIRFVDRFIRPCEIEEAEFIFDMQNSLENSKSVREVKIGIGNMLVLNNHYWLHGRKQFDCNNALQRTLMRQRGCF